MVVAPMQFWGNFSDLLRCLSELLLVFALYYLAE